MNNKPAINKKVIKTGPVTLSLALIITGMSMLLINLGGIESFNTLWKFWPLLLVGLGIEYFIRKLIHKDVDIRFSIGSIFAIIMLVIAGSVINLFANINIIGPEGLIEVLKDSNISIKIY
ncbi:MAG: hypothetical protein FH758_13745 [Firmicutes bacterium]|nr:hypothetical protein [Bacillota bacterium]